MGVANSKSVISLYIKRISRVLSPLTEVEIFELATEILPKGYSLSLVIITDKKARQLNVKYRKKTYTPNVLSFPLSKKDGELFLNLTEAKRQWRRGKISGRWKDWVALLVIHSFCHLKGSVHGRTMEREVSHVMKKYGFAASVIIPNIHT